MLVGQTFRLNKDTLAIERVAGSRTTVQIAAGSVVRVASATIPEDSRMVDVIWHERMLTIFLEDLRARGEEVLSTNN